MYDTCIVESRVTTRGEPPLAIIGRAVASVFASTYLGTYVANTIGHKSEPFRLDTAEFVLGIPT